LSSIDNSTMYAFSDITTPNSKAKGNNDETEKYPNTPLQRYMQELQQYQHESMASIYTHTVDRPCLHNMCESNIDGDYFLTSCRQPLSFLPFGKGAGGFGGDETNDGDDWMIHQDSVLPMAGAYTVPTDCEYCGSQHVSMCDPTTCERPKLFFKKRRPPFCQPDPQEWDPVTEFRITNSTQEEKEGNSKKEEIEQNESYFVDDREFKQLIHQTDSSTSPSKSVKNHPYYPSIPSTATTTSTMATEPISKQNETDQFDNNDISFTQARPPTPMAWMMHEFFGIQKNNTTPSKERVMVT